MKNAHNFLKSFSKHDEALLSTMTHMVASHPNASIVESSFNIIKVEGDGLSDFLQTLVQQVPVLDMKVYKVNNNTVKKQKKYKTNHGNCDLHCVYFTFHGLRN